MRPQARRQRWPTWLGLALLVVFGFALGLAVAEMVIRRQSVPSNKSYMVADPVFHHRLRPNFNQPVLGTPFSTNSLGLRDREFTIPKPPDVVRIVMLGDSFTEGGGLPIEATVARRVEFALRAGPCGNRVEVVNAGQASYSPILEYLLLRDVGLRLQPDLVVLNFDMTDVHDDFIRTHIATLDAGGLPVAITGERRREASLLLPPVGPRLLHPLEERLAGLSLYQAVRKSGPGLTMFGRLTLTPEQLEARGLVGDLRYDRLAITRDIDSDQLRLAWTLTQRYIVGIRDLAHRHRARFALVVYPYAHQVSATASPGGRRRMGIGAGFFASRRPFDILEEEGRRRDIPVINLLDLFREREATDGPLFREGDIHHTVEGAAVFGEGIAQGLRALRLVACDHSVELQERHPHRIHAPLRAARSRQVAARSR